VPCIGKLNTCVRSPDAATGANQCWNSFWQCTAAGKAGVYTKWCACTVLAMHALHIMHLLLPLPSSPPGRVGSTGEHHPQRSLWQMVGRIHICAEWQISQTCMRQHEECVCAYCAASSCTKLQLLFCLLLLLLSRWSVLLLGVCWSSLLHPQPADLLLLLLPAPPWSCAQDVQEGEEEATGGVGNPCMPLVCAFCCRVCRRTALTAVQPTRHAQGVVSAGSLTHTANCTGQHTVR
jgi:hypothetical protein